MGGGQNLRGGMRGRLSLSRRRSRSHLYGQNKLRFKPIKQLLLLEKLDSHRIVILSFFKESVPVDVVRLLQPAPVGREAGLVRRLQLCERLLPRVRCRSSGLRQTGYDRTRGRLTVKRGQEQHVFWQCMKVSLD